MCYQRVLPAVVLALTAPAAFAAVSSASAVFFGAGFIDVQGAAIQVGAVQSRDGLVAFGVVGHLDEPEASGLSSVAVGYDAHAVDCAEWFKQGANLLFGCTEAEVSYKNILHLEFPFDLQSS